jgi:hypothetical protein
MEPLSTYVRVNAQAADDESKMSSTAVAKGSRSEQAAPEKRPPADIRAILLVIGRRDRKYEERMRRLDLSKIDLGGADLIDGHFESANLYGDTSNPPSSV